MNINDIIRLATIYNKIAQTQMSAGDSLTSFQAALYHAGLLGTSEDPANSANPQLDYNSAVFTKYINPALDKLAVNSKININITVRPDLSIVFTILPANPQLQHMLDTTLKPAMERVLKTSKIVKKFNTPLTWQWIQNYG